MTEGMATTPTWIWGPNQDVAAATTEALSHVPADSIDAEVKAAARRARAEFVEIEWGEYKGPETHHKAGKYYASYYDTPGVKDER